MTKKPQFLQFLCNQGLVRARGLFLAKGYRGYTGFGNFLQWIFTTLNFALLYFTLCKVFQFLCVSVTLIAQAILGLGYTDIFSSVTERFKYATSFTRQRLH
jgi:hypothetical protein